MFIRSKSIKQGETNFHYRKFTFLEKVPIIKLNLLVLVLQVSQNFSAEHKFSSAWLNPLLTGNRSGKDWCHIILLKCDKRYSVLKA